MNILIAGTADCASAAAKILESQHRVIPVVTQRTKETLLNAVRKYRTDIDVLFLCLSALVHDDEHAMWSLLQEVNDLLSERKELVVLVLGYEHPIGVFGRGDLKRGAILAKVNLVMAGAVSGTKVAAVLKNIASHHEEYLRNYGLIYGEESSTGRVVHNRTKTHLRDTAVVELSESGPSSVFALGGAHGPFAEANGGLADPEEDTESGEQAIHLPWEERPNGKAHPVPMMKGLRAAFGITAVPKPTIANAPPTPPRVIAPTAPTRVVPKEEHMSTADNQHGGEQGVTPTKTPAMPGATELAHGSKRLEEALIAGVRAFFLALREGETAVPSKPLPTRTPIAAAESVAASQKVATEPVVNVDRSETRERGFQFKVVKTSDGRSTRKVEQIAVNGATYHVTPRMRKLLQLVHERGGSAAIADFEAGLSMGALYQVIMKANRIIRSSKVRLSTRNGQVRIVERY